ncbi:MAG: hypothetical protein HC786_23015 [Richelia sp. CSU_2_1]|nr:hypothetical protein [Richelia sp. CSU_2_1]
MDELEFKNLTLDYSEDGAIAIITLNRPKALNALNSETLQELGAALEACLEPPETMALIITGSGEKGFCHVQILHPQPSRFACHTLVP